jgi:hypothetical protein
VKNTTSNGLAAGTALQIGDYLLADPRRNYLWMNGDTPTDAGRWVWGVLPRAIPAGKIDYAQVSGVCLAKVNRSSSYHKYVRLDSSATEYYSPSYYSTRYYGRGYFGSRGGTVPALVSDWFGSAEILWSESGTGTRWCVIRMGLFAFPTYYGKADGDVPKGSTGTVSIWMGTHTSESDTGENITDVYARMQPILSGARVYVSWVGGPGNGGPEMVSEC